MACLLIRGNYDVNPRAIIPDKNLVYAGGDDLPIRLLRYPTADGLRNLMELRRYIEADLDEMESPMDFWFSLQIIIEGSQHLSRGSISTRII